MSNSRSTPIFTNPVLVSERLGNRNTVLLQAANGTASSSSSNVLANGSQQTQQPQPQPQQPQQQPSQHAMLPLSGIAMAASSQSTTSSSPSPPVSPRTASLSASGGSSDDPHVQQPSVLSSSGGTCPVPGRFIATSSQGSNSSSSNNNNNTSFSSELEWKRYGKSIRLRDSITATLTKKKTGVVQASLPCTPDHRLWYFEVYLEGMDKKASASVGFTSEDYTLSKHVGREPRSYAYHSEEGRKWKNGEQNMDEYGKPYTSGTVIGCGINTVTREIFYTLNGEYLGVAFWGVPEIPLYPSVSLRGAIGLTCVATFHGPFKFDLHTLPDISPSHWHESLGDPTLGDEQVLYPAHSNSRAHSTHGGWQSNSGGLRSSHSDLHGLASWTANDVAIWLEVIGYGQHRRVFYENNISGRHLHTLTSAMMKTDLGIESFGHRADIEDRAKKLLATWKERVSAESDTSTLLDSGTTSAVTDLGSHVSEISDYQHEHSLMDSTPHGMNDDLLIPVRSTSKQPQHLQQQQLSQQQHHISDHETSEDESGGSNRSLPTRGRNNSNSSNPATNLSSLVSTMSLNNNNNYNTNNNNNNGNNNGNNNNSNNGNNNNNVPPGASAFFRNVQAASTSPDSRWRRRTVPYSDSGTEDFAPPPSTTTSLPTTTHPRTSSIPGPSPTSSTASTSPPHPQTRPRTNTIHSHLPVPPGQGSEGPDPSMAVFPLPDYPFLASLIGTNLTPALLPNPPTNPFMNGAIGIPSPVSTTANANANNTSAKKSTSFLTSSPIVARDRESSPRVPIGSLTPTPAVPSLPITSSNNQSSAGVTSPVKGLSNSFGTLPSVSSSPSTTATTNSALTHSASIPLIPASGGDQPSSARQESARSAPSPTKMLSEGHLSDRPVRHEWEIDFEELELGPVIGKGFFGEVKRGSWRETDVAIKIIYRDSFKNKSSIDMFMNEVSILSKLRHPCVVQFLGACITGEHHCIVTEWMTGGSLRSFLTAHFNAITPLVRIKIGTDIAKGMNYLHGWTPPILHRDLSSRNILLDVDECWMNPSPAALPMGQGARAASLRCKVADFGLSRLKLEHGVMTSSVGCVPYMAPEVFRGDPNSEKSDMYSFGMIMWELLTGEEPQQELKPFKMAYMVAHNGYRPLLPHGTSAGWQSMITLCWGQDPDTRPTFKQIIAMLREMEEAEKVRASLEATPPPPQTPSQSVGSSNSSIASLTVPLAVSLPSPVRSTPSLSIGEYTD